MGGDGRLIGFSELPWSRVEFPTGPLSAGRHEVVAAVDSTVDAEKTKLFWNFYDFYPFGGFHHGVSMTVQERPVEIRRVVARTRDYRTGTVELEAQFAGGKGPTDFTADVAFNDGEYEPVTFRNRRAVRQVPAFELWSPESPRLTSVKVRHQGRLAAARFGIRQVGTEKGRITLNGRRIYLKGVNRHEAHYEFGATTPVQLMYEDLQNAMAMGCNFIRGSHYPQSDAFLTLCDELGLLVWEESLGWGNRVKQLSDPVFRRLQEEQTRLMVRNSINHPSVIISGFLNEPESEKEVCRTLVDRLIDVIRAEDTGHLVTFACHHALADVSHARTDIIAYNAYPAWYSHELETGSSDELRRSIRTCHEDIVRAFRARHKDERPILVSETDAKTYTRLRGMRNRSYGVNTGGLYDLYRRPKLAAEEAARLFNAKKTDE